MKLLASCTILVALLVGAHLAAGVGSGYELILLFGFGAVLKVLPAGLLRAGPLNGVVVFFWLDMVAFAMPAGVLFAIRRWLGAAYPILLGGWAGIHVALIFFGGSILDSP